MITRFLREFAFRESKHTACFIDPERDNAIAIRAYAKAGFRHVRDVADEDGAPVHLMGISRRELMR